MLGLGAAMAARGKASKGSEERMESFMFVCVYVSGYWSERHLVNRGCEAI
jgi:hypothetical protein